ncbi:MAG: sigma-70 family RNA polymerase sigma factor [Ktedonobacterales bacterium]
MREERGERDNGNGDGGGCSIATTPDTPDAVVAGVSSGVHAPRPPAQDIANGEAAGGALAASGAHTAPSAQRIRAIYEAHLNAVYRFIYSKVGNREEAEDLTSQVFLKALRGLDDSRDQASVQAWLFQVARTTIADHWRVFYRLPERSLDDMLAVGWDSAIPNAAPVSDQQRVESRAQEILNQLPARYREILSYRFLLNYSLKETAARMGLSEANVKVLQFRALKKAAQLETDAVRPSDPFDSAKGGAS